MTHDVFISYSSKDQKIVEALSHYLEERGVRCFVAYRDIPKGKVWASTITEAIDNCQLMVVIFSKDFNQSEQVDREIELCSEEKKPILTFRIHDEEFRGAKKYYLKNLNWIDAFPNPNECFQNLYESVAKLIMIKPHSVIAEVDDFKEKDVDLLFEFKETTKNSKMESVIILKSKRLFFVLDLLLSSLWALFVLRLWTGFVMSAICVEQPLIDLWAAPIVFYLVVLRLVISLMILHEDRYGVWVSLFLLFGSVVSFLLSKFVLMDAIPDVFNYFNLACGGWFDPDIRRFEYLFSADSYNQVVDASWGVFLFCWVWLMPFVYFLIHRKKLTSTGNSLITALSGLYLIKNSIGKKYLYVCALFLSALIIGMMMVSFLSLVGLLAVSYVFYRIVGKWENRTIKDYEWIYMVFAAFGVWLAQYQYGSVRIVLLTVGVLLTFLLVIKISKGSIFRRAVMVIFAGMILPSLCLGYNVFALTDCKRVEMLHAQYNLTGVFKVQDSQGRIGLRDRYRMIIPAQYSEIEDYHLPYLKVKKDSLWGIWNTQYAGFVKGDYDHVIVGVDYNNSSYEDLCFQVKPAFAFLEPLEENMESFRFKRNAADTTASLGKLFPE